MESQTLKKISEIFQQNKLKETDYFLFSRFFMNISMLDDQFIIKFYKPKYNRILLQILMRKNNLQSKEVLFALSNFAQIDNLNKLIFNKSLLDKLLDILKFEE